MIQRLAIGITLSALLIGSCFSFAQYELTPFLERVELSVEGLQSFYGRYNHPLFIKGFLPRSCQNEIDLLSYAKGKKNPYEYTYAVTNIFHQRFKGCTSKNPFALNDFLIRLPELVGSLFENNVVSKESIRLHLLEKLEAVCGQGGIYVPADEIEGFIENLSFSIDAEILKPAKTFQKTQLALVRYIESMLDKLEWDFSQPLEAWQIFKDIISSLKLLLEYRIIPDTDAFSQLLWSLIYRFSTQIEHEGSIISLEDYNKIGQDIAQNKVALLSIPEKERLIASKMNVLCKAFHTGQGLAVAYSKNIFSPLIARS